MGSILAGDSGDQRLFHVLASVLEGCCTGGEASGAVFPRPKPGHGDWYGRPTCSSGSDSSRRPLNHRPVHRHSPTSVCEPCGSVRTKSQAAGLCGCRGHSEMTGGHCLSVQIQENPVPEAMN